MVVVTLSVIVSGVKTALFSVEMSDEALERLASVNIDHVKGRYQGGVRLTPPRDVDGSSQEGGRPPPTALEVMVWA